MIRKPSGTAGQDRMNMKKVLVYHKTLTSFLAGGTFQPLMFIAELQKNCDVTLALNGDADIEAVAKMSEIAIDVPRLKVVRLDPREGFLTKHEYLLMLYRMRKLKALAKDLGIETGKIKSKSGMISAITAVEVEAPADDELPDLTPQDVIEE